MIEIRRRAIVEQLHCGESSNSTCDQCDHSVDWDVTETWRCVDRTERPRLHNTLWIRTNQQNRSCKRLMSHWLCSEMNINKRLLSKLHQLSKLGNVFVCYKRVWTNYERKFISILQPIQRWKFLHSLDTCSHESTMHCADRTPITRMLVNANRPLNVNKHLPRRLAVAQVSGDC